MEERVYEFQRKSPQQAKRRVQSRRKRSYKVRPVPIVILSALCFVLGCLIGMSSRPEPVDVISATEVIQPTPEIVVHYIEQGLTDEEVIERALQILPEYIFRPQYTGVTLEGLSEIPVPIYQYTEEELRVFANLIFYEGGGESYDTQVKIGSVVINRVFDESGEFPDDLIGVIYHKPSYGTYQFSPAATRDLYANIDIPQNCWDAAEYCLTFGSDLPEEVMVFYAKYLLDNGSQNWVTSRTVYEISGSTVFAYLNY